MREPRPRAALDRYISYLAIAAFLACNTPEPTPEPAPPSLKLELAPPTEVTTDTRFAERAASTVEREVGGGLCDAITRQAADVLEVQLDPAFVGGLPDAEPQDRKAWPPALLARLEVAAPTECAITVDDFKLDEASRKSAWLQAGLRVSGAHQGAIQFARARLTLTVKKVGGSWRVTGADVTRLAAHQAPRRPFTDVSAQAGVAMERPPPAAAIHQLEIDSRRIESDGGLAMFDFEPDGDADFAAWQPGRSLTIFVNDGVGGFDQLRTVIPSRAVGPAMLFVDLDGDGVLEIVSSAPTCLGGHRFLPLFRRVEARYELLPQGIPLDARCESLVRLRYVHLTAADIDRDGDLDLLVSAYESTRQAPQANRFKSEAGLANLLYLNDGELRFREDAAARGLTSRRATWGGAFFDADDDGDLDLYLVNDRADNELLINDGRGRFTEGDQSDAMALGLSRAATPADLDGDLELDLFVANEHTPTGLRITRLATDLPEARAEELRRMAKGNDALIRRVPGLFDDQADKLGVAQAGRAWGHVLLDVDNDGLRDLYVVSGGTSHSTRGRFDYASAYWAVMRLHAIAKVTDQPVDALVTPRLQEQFNKFDGSYAGLQPDRLFRGQPGGTYHEEARAWGLDLTEDGRAVAALDMDGDGDLDLVHRSLQSIRLLRNEVPPRRWIAIEPREANGAPAVGAQVTVTAGDHKQLAQVNLTAGFQTQVLPVVHFGLGDAERADVEIRWLDGTRDRHTGLAAGRIHRFTRGGEKESPRAPAQWTASPTGHRAVLGARLDVPTIEGQRQPLVKRGRPAVLLVWDPSDEASVTALGHLNQLAKRFRGQVDFIGATTEVGSSERTQAAMLKHQIEFDQRRANPALTEALFGKGAGRRTPAVFVVDPQGRVTRAFFGAFEPSQITVALNATAPQTTSADLFAYARAADANKDGAQAQGILNQLSQAAGADEGLRLMITAAHLQASRLEPALAEVDRTLAQYPESADARAFRATVLYALKRKEEAEAEAQRALGADPGQPSALRIMGLLYHDRGEREAAIEAFTMALEEEPDLADIRHVLDRLQNPPE